MVDARNEAVGRLYKGKDGEHLVNVALSRARHKLTVVGDVVCLSKKGGAIGALVSNKVRGVFNHLCNMIN
jgi:superfamily I DNA and/or RNA helicase